MEMVIISKELFIENSPVKVDTLVDKFVPYLGIAQKLYIAPTLGVPLLTELQVQIKSQSIDPTNQGLLLKIAPALSFYAVYQGLPFHWASIINKGLTILESENSKGVDVKDVAQLRRWLKDDAEVLLQQLIDYLCGCRGVYPLWAPSNNISCRCGSCASISIGCGSSGTGSTARPLDTGIYIPLKYRN